MMLMMRNERSMAWGENRKIRNICETWKVPPSRCTHTIFYLIPHPTPTSHPHTTLTAVMNKHIHMRSICYQLELQQTENFSLRFHLSLAFFFRLFLRSFQNHTSFLFAQSFSFPFQPKKREKWSKINRRVEAKVFSQNCFVCVCETTNWEMMKRDFSPEDKLEINKRNEWRWMWKRLLWVSFEISNWSFNFYFLLSRDGNFSF